MKNIQYQEKLISNAVVRDNSIWINFVKIVVVNEEIIVSVEISVEASYSIVHYTLDNDIMFSKT